MEAPAGVEMKGSFWLTGQCFPAAPEDCRKINDKTSVLWKHWLSQFKNTLAMS